MKVAPQAGDALVIVDVQADFVSGSLAVPGAAEVVPTLNRHIEAFRALRLPIVATRDWHPPHHVSFASRGGPWPVHCVAGSAGAQFARRLLVPAEAHVISKATDAERDAYSAFDGTTLDALLYGLRVRRLFVGGLATDYCVLHTVLDARRLGYEVFLLGDAMRAVNVSPGDEAEALRRMEEAGAKRLASGELACA